MRMQFLGAAGVVTGSRTLLRTTHTRILVDCGLFQGFKHLRERNWERLDVMPLDAVVLTHAHLDHSGWFPALVRQGYQGPLYCTAPTAALLSILWPDSGRIQEEDAAQATRHKSSKHDPVLPLYTERDAIAALDRVVPIDLGVDKQIGDFTIRFQSAGHILGAASVLVTGEDHRVLFSGDLGREGDPVVPAPDAPPIVDSVVMESTYGNRRHPEVDRDEELADVVRRTVERGGMLLIPSFAVGRAQGLLWSLYELTRTGRIPKLEIVLDSPMASHATAAFLAHPSALRLTPEKLQAMTADVTFVQTVEQSKALNDKRGPFILISASGMLTGGRVLHHIIRRAPEPKNTLLFVGFQAPGTRGADIVKGADMVRIYGSDHDINCHVAQIGGFSAHGDSKDLMDWLQSAEQPPKHVFLNHGEPDATEALRRSLRAAGYDVKAATERVEWQLGDDVRAIGTAPVAHAVGGVMHLLEHASGLSFGDDDAGSVDAVRAALTLMETGELPRMPIKIRGQALARTLKESLPPEALLHLTFPEA